MDSAEQPHRCKCKVGSCPLCGSACKRCGCAYDGVEPGVALAQSSGQRGPKRLSTGSEQREAAKRARIEIAKATELEERTIGTEPTIKQELQSLYPGRYTLPGEDEIRAEITKLFGRKKASDEDNAVEASLFRTLDAIFTSTLCLDQGWRWLELLWLYW
ncbi:hypothetical protein EMCRGX_G005624 [Ephydatia muelleri]